MEQGRVSGAAAKTKRALIVDDSRTACVVLARMLAHFQIESDSVYSAESAIEFLTLEKPDVIFMDHAMPGMNGLDALKILKASPENATVPVMMYTARTGEVYLSQARALGAIDVLPKGSELTVLEEALQRIGLISLANVAHVSPPDANHSSVVSERSSQWSEAEVAKIIARTFRSELRPAMTHQMHDALDEWRNENLAANRHFAEVLGKRMSVSMQEALKPIQADIDWHRSESLQNLANSRKLVGLVTASLVFSVMLISVIWWFSRDHETPHELANLRTQVQQLVSSQERMSQEMATFTDAIHQVSPPKAEVASYGILATSGEPIGTYAGMSANGADVLLISRSGYRFNLDNTGQISNLLEKRYFNTPNCFGEAYAPVHAGVVFKLENDELWYSPLDSKSGKLQVYSSMDANGICQAYKGDAIVGRAILMNDVNITEVNNSRFELEPRLVLLNAEPAL